MKATTTCPSCEGKRGRQSFGRRAGLWIKCHICRGTGKVTKERAEEVLRVRAAFFEPTGGR